jgi:hypothetical protein
MVNGKWKMKAGVLPLGAFGRGIAIITDSFYGAAREGFLARHLFFLVLWLLKNKGITILIRTHEVFWSRISANIAVDTRRVDIVTS